MNTPTTQPNKAQSSPMKIIDCTCKHEYQDKTHGKGKRAANPCNNKTKTKVAHRCTVCGKQTD
jgi:hypothetical protein